jgi:hypothetical protein
MNITRLLLLLLYKTIPYREKQSKNIFIYLLFI